MSDNIAKITDKQLRNEVQLLRDELALMKRKFEDIIYNLDTDNFSSRFVKEQGNMKTAIEINAKGIKTKVSQEDLYKNLSEYTTLEQTANAIKTQAYASADLSSAEEISDISKAIDKSKTYYISTTDALGTVTKTYYYYNEISKEWEEIVGGGIESVFEQTATGFKLKGNVAVDGSCILTESLKFDSSDKPIDVEYSVDGVSGWHSKFNSENDKFMRLKIGANWSNAMKIVGEDGSPGSPGSPGENGVVDYSTIASILEQTYSIESTSIGSASIASPTIYSASLYSPDIYGENITLTMQNGTNGNIYNNLNLTPTSMSLINSYGVNEKEKFAIDLGSDSDNSYVLMRLGAGINAYHNNALIIEKYLDYIKIGSDTQANGFVGLTITPSTGEMRFYGTTVGGTAVAVFG